MSKFLLEACQDVEGAISSKRLICFSFTILLISLCIANTFFRLPVDHDIFSSIRDIVMTGLTMIGAEKFSNKGETN